MTSQKWLLFYTILTISIIKKDLYLTPNVHLGKAIRLMFSRSLYLFFYTHDLLEVVIRQSDRQVYKKSREKQKKNINLK